MSPCIHLNLSFSGQVVELEQVCAVVERAGGAAGAAAAAEGHLRRAQEPLGGQHRYFINLNQFRAGKSGGD